MFIIQARKYFGLLLILVFAVTFADAQAAKRHRKSVVKKVSVEKPDAANSDAAKTTETTGAQAKTPDSQTDQTSTAAKPADSKKRKGKKAADTEKPIARGRLPIIFIPGLIGSELVNKNTKGKVWFDLGRAKDDDVRLPISPDIRANKDNLIAGDILRKIKIFRLTPDIIIYQKLINILKDDGFTESKIDEPDAAGYADTFYVFPYDWRLDNVENAQLLVQKMDEIRAKTKHPRLKFNVVTHSMGGLIARYAEMYGAADLSAQQRPTWKGANYFNTISLVATPNGGTTSALDSLLNGFSLFGGGRLNLPFVQNLSKFDLFTIPSIYQLLPHEGTLRAFDENLKPIKLDVYDPATWEKYNWTTYTDPNFAKKFDDKVSPEEAKAYFYAVLHRAKLFNAALDAKPAVKNPVPLFYLGASCKETVDGIIIRKAAKGDFLETDFGAANYVRSDGTKVSGKETSKFLTSLGDGVVPKRSLLASYVSFGKLRNFKTKAVINDLTNSCDEHNKLTGNAKVDQVLISVINNKPIEEAQTAISKTDKK